MSNYRNSPAKRGITLNSLQQQLYSLNMRFLLAMQSHDESEQNKLHTEMEKVLQDIELLNMGKKI